MRIALGLEYDGSGFRGWQSQAGGGTVQDVMEAALSVVADAPVRVVCAGRTDAGVHASRALIYRTRRAAESSLMAKGIFAGAARDSEAVAG
mgnify:CR=1 FL=1